MVFYVRRGTGIDGTGCSGPWRWAAFPFPRDPTTIIVEDDRRIAVTCIPHEVIRYYFWSEGSIDADRTGYFYERIDLDEEPR